MQLGIVLGISLDEGTIYILDEIDEKTNKVHIYGFTLVTKSEYRRKRTKAYIKEFIKGACGEDDIAARGCITRYVDDIYRHDLRDDRFFGQDDSYIDKYEDVLRSVLPLMGYTDKDIATFEWNSSTSHLDDMDIIVSAEFYDKLLKMKN
jgi:hypothetical protein